jgi:hypothetical protein
MNNKNKIDKSGISRQLRQQWLTEHEGGTPIFTLAKNYYRDPRTIKRHIDIAAKERYEKEAKVIVIKDALVNHHARLIAHAEKLYKNISLEISFSSDLTDDRMHIALKSHMPRSPLWNYINRINHLYEKLHETASRLTAMLENKINSDKEIPDNESVRIGLLEVLKYQAVEWAKSNRGLDIETHFRTNSDSRNKNSVEYGKFNLGTVTDNDLKQLIPIISKYEKNLRKFKEYDEMHSIYDELKVTKIKAAEELATIIEKGVLPGSCKYCPA